MRPDVVGPGGEGAANPLAAFVGPVDLDLGALEIDGAEIVLDHWGFGGIQMHRECRDSADPASPGAAGSLVPLVVSELSCFEVFSVQQHLPHLREYTCDIGCLEGLTQHEQAFVSETDLLRIWMARHVDTDRSVAGDEKSVTRRCDTAEAPPRQ